MNIFMCIYIYIYIYIYTTGKLQFLLHFLYIKISNE